jgi:Carboxypeptidase regulatory-like domain
MRAQNLFALLLLLVCCASAVAQTALPASPSPTSATVDEPTTGMITGLVVNESGQPFAGVQVVVRQLNATNPGRTLTTDSEGRFRVNGLSSALYFVSASAPGYVLPPTDPSQPINHHRIGDQVKLELIRGGVITGSVTNAAGEPLIAVAVRAWMVRDAKGRVAKIPNTFFVEQTTDDRGIYRIYGLMPGTYVVSAGGVGFSQRFQLNPYAYDTPTYAPSSTRDGATEVSVQGGEESNVDIRYRGERGHAISGSVKLTGSAGASISLSSVTGGFISFGGLFQQPGNRGFEFYGLADGDYVIVAREVVPGSAPLPAELLMSEPRRVTVKGADVTGLELVTRPLSSLSGRVILEPTKPAECEGKRRPLFSEMMVTVQRAEKDMQTDLLPFYPTSNSGSPDAKGSFAIRNLIPGRYMPQPKFYARYWYLNSMTIAGTPKIDAAANWATLKIGERTDVTISLAEGAASIRGKLSGANGTQLPSNLGVYLVPAEREKNADVLRYFVTSSEADGTFAFNNLPPGRYLALTQTLDADTATIEKLRLPEAAETRAKLRRSAEAQKIALELKPCQNLTDYQLSLK